MISQVVGELGKKIKRSNNYATRKYLYQFGNNKVVIKENEVGGLSTLIPIRK